MNFLSTLKIVGGVGLSVAVVAVGIGGYAFLVRKQQHVTSEVVQNEMSGTAQELVAMSQLDRTVLSLQFSEEVLAQSARNYATSGEVTWKSRYELMHPEFIRAIDELRAASQTAVHSALTEVIRSGERLAVISNGAMSLVDEGRASDALAVLDGSQYTGEKTLFERGLNEYTASRGEQTATLLQTYESARTQVQEAVREIMYVSGALVVFMVLAALVAVVAITRLRKSTWAHVATALQRMVRSGVTQPLGVPSTHDTKSIAEHVNVLADAVANGRGKSQALLHTAQEPLLVIAEDGTVQSANAAALKIFGVSKQDLVGKSLDETGALLQPDIAEVRV